MAINLLEATQIINMPLGIPGKPAKLFDGGGLYIENSFGGTKAWRVRVRKDGRDTAVSLGVFPALSLKAARAAARAVLSDSPAAALAPAAPAGKTFREVALMYHANGSKSWAAGTATEILRSLEARVFPVIGDTLIATLTPLKVMEAITPIESPKVAHKVRQRIAAVFSYADALDLLPGKNPAANLARVMEAPAKGGNRPAVLDLAAARAVIAVSESAAGQATTRLAARFLALTAQRPGEVRNAEWSEMKRDFQIDGIPAPHWHIPAAKMKARKQHFVPLSVQALEVLAEIEKISGGGKYDFPASNNPAKPLSESTIGDVYIACGLLGKHCPHGWRATFSTIMNGLNRDDRHAIDLFLAHQNRDKTESAYNRQEHITARAALAQQWADLLLEGARPVVTLASLPRKIKMGTGRGGRLAA